MLRRTSLLTLLAVTARLCNAAEPGVVARIGHRNILSSEVSCGTETGTARCRAIQQSKFAAIARKTLISEAARLHHISVSDAEVLHEARPGSIPSDAKLEGAAGRVQWLARAAIKVREGAPADRVFAEDLAPRGLRREQFDAALAAYPTATAARADLERMTVSVMRGQLLDQQRERIYTERLAVVIADAAARDGVSVDVATAQFWRDVAASIEIEIVDDRFELPDMKSSETERLRMKVK